MDITKLLMEQLGNQGMEMLSKKVGVAPHQAATAMEGIVPSLLGAMTSNAQSPEGANGLLSALDRDHDGSIFDDITGFFSSDSAPAAGEGILRHVLGDKQEPVAQNLGAKTGMSASQIMQMMKFAAPMIMGYLGKQRRQNPEAVSSSGIASLLGGLTGAADKGTGLDLGDILNVVGAFTGGGNSNSGGIGGMLKGLFGN